jgi:Outer membrane protein beta-barrel domain
VKFNRALVLLPFFLLATPAFAEQDYVSRYDVYVGYDFLNSNTVNLFQNGFHIQAGVKPRKWYALGFDYSRSDGNLTVKGDQLTSQLQQQLAPMLEKLAAAGMVPAGYQLKLNADAVTQTFAAGPQLTYRHFSRVTMFVRPSLGAIQEVATLKPHDAITKLAVAALAPTGEKTDWTYFYGFGGGFDFIASHHFALRIQADYVRNHLFSDTMANARNTVRFSVGPAFSFGKPVER